MIINLHFSKAYFRFLLLKNVLSLGIKPFDIKPVLTIRIYIDKKIKEGFQRLLDPHQPSYTIENYTELVTSINDFVFELARRWFETTARAMDTKFKKSDYRKQNYYVNKTYSRSLVTVFGRINITRTLYTCKRSKKSYCYVDRKLGLPKYDRYDPCVKSLVVELYANQNSMIKTGQIIGDKIHSLYSLESSRKYFSLSRQTVMNILKSFGQVIIEIIKEY